MGKKRAVSLLQVLMAAAGLLAVADAAMRIASPAGRAYLPTLLALSGVLALLGIPRYRMPSGAVVNPSMILSASSIFLLPTNLVALVHLPGMLLGALISRRAYPWLPLQVGQGAVALCSASLVYRLAAPAGPQGLAGMLPAAALALFVHFVVLQAALLVAVAARERRPLGEQARLLLLGDLNWGTAGLYTLCITVAATYQRGYWELALQAFLAFCLSKAVAYNSQVSIWRQAARTDGLTGVGNRAGWDAFVKVLDRSASPPEGTLVVLDLDGLKLLNDRHGHATGDAALRDLASALRGSLRASDRIFRYGGDEFVTFVRHSPESDGFIRERLLPVVDQFSAQWTSRGCPVSASIGMATVPREASTMTEAFLLADSRMYAAKARRSAEARRALS